MQHTYDKDPYAILGISPTATTSQVKQAYHSLARQYHPDLNKDPRAAERMKDINWANDILSDPQERAMYDMWRCSGVRVEYQPGNNPPPSNTEPPRGSPPLRRRAAQDPWAQGCSPTPIIIIIVILMNMIRSQRTASQAVYSYPTDDLATQVAELDTMVAIVQSAQGSHGLPTPDGSITPPSIYMTLLAPVSTVTAIPPVPSKTIPTPSPDATILRDKAGHEDLRSKIIPGSQEWEWIHHYFPDLTTTDGLTEEVTFVYWDQIQRAIIIETRASGTYIISTYGGNVIAGHY
jgi:hypothetical protein